VVRAEAAKQTVADVGRGQRAVEIDDDEIPGLGRIGRFQAEP